MERGEAVRPCEGVAVAGLPQAQGLEPVAIHTALSLMAMLAVAHTAVRCCEPGLMRSIKHFTA